MGIQFLKHTYNGLLYQFLFINLLNIESRNGTLGHQQFLQFGINGRGLGLTLQLRLNLRLWLGLTLDLRLYLTLRLRLCQAASRLSKD